MSQPEADADPHLLVPGAAVIPLATHQWPGITVPGVDSTCFGCRPAALVALGRKKREAEAEAEAVAEAVAEAEPEAHGILPLPYPHIAHTAVVPLATHQWPGITTPFVDSTCFGCRPAAHIVVGRRRRGADAEAEAVAEAKPEAHGIYPLSYPLVAHTALVGSSSFQAVNLAGAAYSTGVTALHPVNILGRKKRGAEAQAQVAVNGYAHSLQSGNSFASVSTPNYFGYSAFPASFHPHHLVPLIHG